MSDVCSGSRKELIDHEKGQVDVRKCDSFILNGTADGFCGMMLEDGSVVRELHQNKHVKRNIDLKLFMEEYWKAAHTKDFFILYTTHDSSVTTAELPNRAGIVSKANFEDYFGPFAARSFREDKVSINKATRSQLEAVSGIGPTTATTILNERKRGGLFKDREDFKKRCHTQLTLSGSFLYDN